MLLDASIGVIGGADGPTAIFVASGFSKGSVIAAAITAVVIVVLIGRAVKKKKGNL